MSTCHHRLLSASFVYCSTFFRRQNFQSFHRLLKMNTKQLHGSIISRYAMAFTLMPVVHAAFGFGAKSHKTDEMEGSSSDKQAIQVADELYARNEVDKLYEHLLPWASSSNADLLWRLARATCDKAKASTDPAEKKRLMYEAYECAKQALKSGDNISACHKWFAIMLDYIGEYEGTKVRISKAYDIKQHFLRAIELNPEDATSIHLLGYWCFVFADLPWYQQKIASVLFATPPSSTFEEALKYFVQAESIDPGFYSMNLLMLGKTYLRLKDKEKAKGFLIQARDYHVRTADDKRANSEATELLKTL